MAGTRAAKPATKKTTRDCSDDEGSKGFVFIPVDCGRIHVLVPGALRTGVAHPARPRLISHGTTWPPPDSESSLRPLHCPSSKSPTPKKIVRMKTIIGLVLIV